MRVATVRTMWSQATSFNLRAEQKNSVVDADDQPGRDARRGRLAVVEVCLPEVPVSVERMPLDSAPRCRDDTREGREGALSSQTTQDGAGRDRRRSPRLRMRLPVVVGAGGAEDPREIVEVGLGGVFVATDAPHALRQLVRLRIGPPRGDALELQGMIVRVVSPVEAARRGLMPGVGVQLYGLLPEVEAAWRELFEQGLRAATALAAAESAAAPDAELATIKDLPRGRMARGPVECEEDALAMLAQGYTPEEIAEAAGLDPSIVSAALARASSIPAAPAPPEPGLAVEGVSLLTSVETSRDSSPTVPIVKTLRRPPAPADEPAPARDSRPTGPITSVIRIIGAGQAAAAAPPDDGGAPITEVSTAKLRAEEREKLQLRALGPLQPPALSTLTTSRPRLVAAGLVPLAPTGLLPQVVYRLEMTSTWVIEAFGRATVETGRVIITPAEPRRLGTPVVVCVVHPVTRDELHLPGVVVASTDERGGVAVELAGASEATRGALERLLAAGELGAPTASAQPELSLVRRGVVTGRTDPPPLSRDTRHVVVTEVELLKPPSAPAAGEPPPP